MESGVKLDTAGTFRARSSASIRGSVYAAVQFMTYGCNGEVTGKLS
jgi:hypothetical protein